MARCCDPPVKLPDDERTNERTNETTALLAMLHRPHGPCCEFASDGVLCLPFVSDRLQPLVGLKYSCSLTT